MITKRCKNCIHYAICKYVDRKDVDEETTISKGSNYWNSFKGECKYFLILKEITKNDIRE